MIELGNADKQLIMNMIFQDHLGYKLMPTAITYAKRCQFFRNCCNNFDGWFINVAYADGFNQLWFVVCGDCGEDDWHLEKISGYRSLMIED